jgi:hypothetical protein
VIVRSHTWWQRSPAALLLTVVVFAAASACSGAVPLEAAPGATDARCAEVVVRLPSDIHGLPSRSTDAQGTGAWGEPAQILLRCGVPDPGPSAECITEQGIDWRIDDADADAVRAITYGRSPVTEVVVDARLSGGREILGAVAPALARLPVSERCS